MNHQTTYTLEFDDGEMTVRLCVGRAGPHTVAVLGEYAPEDELEDRRFTIIPVSMTDICMDSDGNVDEDDVDEFTDRLCAAARMACADITGIPLPEFDEVEPWQKAAVLKVVS